MRTDNLRQIGRIFCAALHPEAIVTKNTYLETAVFALILALGLPFAIIVSGMLSA